MRVSGGTIAFFVLFIGLPLTAAAVGQEALPFRQAIDLALAHSSEMAVSQAQTGDQRAPVIADASLTYIELMRWEEPLPILRSEMNVVSDVEYAVGERVKAGIDSPVEQTKAKLLEAQTRVHIAEAEGAV